MFLKQGDGLSRMVEAPYEAEEVLQGLLASYPGLLAGESEKSEAAWLLVQRELGIATEVDGGSRWSLDHLFLDQEGVPTLVEVKRSTDTRIRREVVGQMLDYAANGSTVWSQESIRRSFENDNESNGDESNEALAEFLGPDGDPDEFWERVGLNLKAGRLRLVFVADAIPAELRRIIEFLNEQMAETEVIGIEVKQFKEVDGDLVTLVSNVIGQTQAAKRVKGASASRSTSKWGLNDFEDELVNLKPRAMVDRILALHTRLMEAGADLKMGTGATEPSTNYRLAAGTGLPVSVSFYMNAIAINFAFVKDERSEEEMDRLARLAREIPGASQYLTKLERSGWALRPGMPYEEILRSDESVELLVSKLIEASKPAK